MRWGADRLGAGVYLSEYADLKFAQAVRFMSDVMNGIPSIVYGIFAYIVCVLPMKGFSALSGGFALGIMMIPMITRTSEQFVRMVPSQLREAGLALGVPKWRVIVDIVVPAALAGITTGVMVSLARVAGETAPLLFTAFGNRYWQHSLTQPIAALPFKFLPMRYLLLMIGIARLGLGRSSYINGFIDQWRPVLCDAPQPLVIGEINLCLSYFLRMKQRKVRPMNKYFENRGKYGSQRKY